MINQQGPNARITATVTAWPGVTAATGSRGEWAFRLGRRELGHLHGDLVAHLLLPRSIWRDLYRQGRITDHPFFPGREGWGERALRTEADEHDVILFLRDNYDRAAAARRTNPSARS